MSSPRVGYVGLGFMGQGMADNLLSKGLDLTVWTRQTDKVTSMVARGAKGVKTVAELVAECNVICICMSTVQLSREFLLGPNGIIAMAAPGSIVIDHATVDLNTSKECHTAAAEAGCAFLDAPISGGPHGAAAGTLAIMCGGDLTTFDAALPVLSKMGANVRYMGPAGAGTTMKAVNQLLVGIHTAAAAEAFALCNSAGVNITAASEILGTAWGNSTMATRAAPIMATRSFSESGAPVRNLNKDMAIVSALGRTQGLVLDLTNECASMYQVTSTAWFKHTRPLAPTYAIGPAVHLPIAKRESNVALPQEMVDRGDGASDICGVLEIIEEKANKTQ